MKNLTYLLIIVCLSFLTSCTTMNGEKNIGSNSAIGTGSSQDDNYALSGACTLQKNSLKDRRESFLSNPFKSDNKDRNQNSRHTLSSSKEINTILELCDKSQEYWKTGNNEKALKTLDTAYAAILNLETTDTDIAKQKEELRFLISKRIMEIYTSCQTVVKGQHNEIPVEINEYVQKEIDRLTGSERDFFIRALARSTEYRPMIVKELKEAGLPEELSWLPLIESGFRVQALSPARALGLWQFIPSTGYKFGLKRDYYVDERMDPIKSTKAAIEYMRELHEMFGDWSTVLAAYNCGEGKVLRTIRSQNVNYLDNFWDLYKKLPQETASYVPRFLATIHIINNLEKYDIPPQRKILPLDFRTVAINKQLKLTDIARKLDISSSLLETLNPELKHGLLPPDEYQLRIPEDRADEFVAGINDITPSAPAPPKTFTTHRVRRGETLFTIAKNYGISMGDLAAANNLPRKSGISAGKVLRIPAAGSDSNALLNSNSSVAYRKNDSATKSAIASTKDRSVQESKKSIAKNTIKYKVRTGDTVWSIAKRYNTTPDAIKKSNSMSSYSLSLNQELTIPAFEEITSNSKSQTKEQNSKSIASNNSDTPSIKAKRSTHWVKSGDTLFTIAQKYNMSVQRLFDLNRLSKGSRIFPGQKLLVE